ncbi:MAG: hypothetical protein ACLUFI_07890 [Oscillospiraceae bacterium]
MATWSRRWRRGTRRSAGTSRLEKVETYNKLKEHGGDREGSARALVARTIWNCGSQNTFVYIDFPSPGQHFERRHPPGGSRKCSGWRTVVTLAEVSRRLRMTFTVAKVWKE